MYKIKLSDKYLPIKVTYYEAGKFESIFNLDYHRNPGKTLKGLVRDYLHELRIDSDYRYRSYTIMFGTNTVVSITSYRGMYGKSVLVLVTRKSGRDIFKGQNTYKTDTVLDEIW